MLPNAGLCTVVGFATEPVIAANVSLSPPMDMAFLMASSKLVDSKNASNACGTVS